MRPQACRHPGTQLTFLIRWPQVEQDGRPPRRLVGGLPDIHISVAAFGMPSQASSLCYWLHLQTSWTCVLWERRAYGDHARGRPLVFQE